jgi:hypothetical protein
MSDEYELPGGGGAGRKGKGRKRRRTYLLIR